VTAAQQALVGMASTIERNVAEQEKASGAGAGGGGGDNLSPLDMLKRLEKLGLPVDVAKKLLAERFLPRAIDGQWMSPARFSQLERELLAIDDGNWLLKHGWAADGLDKVSRVLGPLGAVLSFNEYLEGSAHHDSGQQLVGGIGTVGAVAPFPFSIAAAGALAYGELTLPITNEEQDGTIQMAMAAHFGSSYDPNNMTTQQSDWLVNHYSGVGGFFNSISDGVDYKREKFFTGAGHAWDGFTGWVSGS
jgi:hypothetical protein